MNKTNIEADDLKVVQARFKELAAMLKEIKTNQGSRRKGRAADVGASQKTKPDSITHDDYISFRLPTKWKANIEQRLEGMGLPKRRHAEFYRGAIIAGLGTAMRANRPNWQAFLEAVQPIAQAKLGMKLTDEGLAAILRQGTILPGTPD